MASFTSLHTKRDSSEELQRLFERLENALSPKKKGRSMKNINKLFESGDEIISWKFNEWDYGKDNIKLPSDARGLFTTTDAKNPQIVSRGYDKFFNIDETYKTKWDYLKENTRGPYEFTLKENGCIIFISGLATGELVVCSKHSTGYREDLTRNHALRGKLEIEKQIAAIGKTKEELALLLHSMNVTAVAELCDDSFEEHVLEYSKDQAGLYLHGLNYNTISFHTYQMKKVNEFATEWGFQKVEYFVEPYYDNLKNFLEDCAKTGTYNGREIEGFVIRSKLEDGSDFFFKYKFEEPYLMYRQFREATKAFINGIPVNEIRINKHKYVTSKYLDHVIPILNSDPIIAQRYKEGHGIIELRNSFLKENSKKGIELANLEETLPDIERLVISLPKELKYVFVSVATIGCGKTTTFQTLHELFPNWAHIQNDNITSKAKNQLMKDCLEKLTSSSCPVVFCDRNNHQYRERSQIFNEFSNLKGNYLHDYVDLKFICLNFVGSTIEDEDEKLVIGAKPDNKLWNISQKRILKRGDNHQSIHVSDGEKFVENIMKGFVSRFQPINSKSDPDDRFDLIINLEVDSEDSSLRNAQTILQKLNHAYPDLVSSMPTDEAIQAAFQKALTYKAEIKKFVGGKRNNANDKKSKQKITYFSIGIVDPVNLLLKIDELFEAKFEAGKSVSLSFWQALRQLDRVQKSFHVTLAHIASTGKQSPKDNKQIWDHYNKVFASQINRAVEKEVSNYIELDHYADVKLKSLVFDKKVLCIRVEILRFYVLSPEGEFVPAENELKCLNKYPHITIGTVSHEVKPFFSNVLLNETFFDSPELEDGAYGDTRVYNWEDEVVLEKMRVLATL